MGITGILVIAVTTVLSTIKESVGLESTYAISFQSDCATTDCLTTEEWAEYIDKIPRMEQFTVCHWDKLQYFSADINSIWSYCFIKTYNSSPYCVQLHYSLILSTANRHIKLNAALNFNLISENIVPFPHRTWNHVCWSYSSINGKNKLYFNGRLINTVVLQENNRPVVEGHNDTVDSYFVLGQEPDKIRGGYNVNQVYSGQIAELNMWNFILEDEIVSSMAQCKDTRRGNIIEWDINKWKVNKALIRASLNVTLFCKKNKQLIIFPRRQPLYMAERYCSVHGGKIVTPNSEEENKEVNALVQNYSEYCVNKNNTSSRNWGLLTWIGIKRIGAQWYNVKENNTLEPLKYAAEWAVDPINQGERVVECSYMQSDGMWSYPTSSNELCKELKICTVCSIIGTPIFTLKGTCMNTAINWNYYLKVNDGNQITHYDGYKRISIMYTDNQWRITENELNVSLSAKNKLSYPIGRLLWELYEPACEINSISPYHLTISNCEFGEKYTCDSGHCIALQKRCDQVIDCKDESDEKDCGMIQIPDTYNKLDFPKLKQGAAESTPLYISIIIETIDLIDTTDMVMELTVTIKMKWTDGRLRLRNMHHGESKRVPSKVAKDLWVPLDYLEHDNAIIGKIHKTSNQRDVTISALSTPMPMDLTDAFENQYFNSFDNNLVANERYRAQYKCTFLLQKFPFDKQNCNFTVHLNLQDNLTFHFEKDNNGVVYKGGEIVNQFDVGEIMSWTGRDGNKIWLKYDIGMQRLFINQIITTIFPTCLLWLLAYFSLFIKEENFNNRFMGSVTSLLVLAALLGSINNSLPTTSYFKYIDLWFLWYISNIFLIIVYHILIDNVKDETKKKSNIVAPTTNTSQVAMENNYCWDVEVGNTTQQFKNRKCFNKVGMFLFPLLTLCFNVFYFLNTI